MTLADFSNVFRHLHVARRGPVNQIGMLAEKSPPAFAGGTVRHVIEHAEHPSDHADILRRILADLVERGFQQA